MAIKTRQTLAEKDFAKPREDQAIQREGVPPPAGVEPTFREFVHYLIDTDLASYGDDHWMPYYLFCTPCLVKYDIIAKVDIGLCTFAALYSPYTLLTPFDLS